MRRLPVLLMVTLLGLVGAAPPASAGGAFPASLPLPAGSYPEGIAVGTGTDFYVGSLFGGGLYAGDLRTGEGAVVVPGVEGRVVAGLSYDARSGLLWGAGSESGSPTVFVFDPAAGALVLAVAVPVAGPPALLNDLVVTRTAVYVTDSFADVLWVVPLSARGLPSGPVEPLPLTGDFVLVTEGDLPINLNGIAATPDGRWLLSAHTALGVLYRVDPRTGEALELDLGGASVPSGDGVVLHGRTAYVVQNFLNQVAVVTLDPGLASGQVTDVIRDDEHFRVPTTAAVFGSSLYLVNGRFDVAFPPFFGFPPVVLDYDVVRVPR